MSAEADEIMQRVGGVVRGVFDDAAREMVEEIREELSVQGNSRVRSLPGEPPRRQSGSLKSRVQYRLVENPADIYVLTISDDADYSGYLELGTRKMAPRPFLSPIESKWAPLMPQRFEFTLRLAGGHSA